MKKIVLMTMALVTLTVATSWAQKQSKAEKEAEMTQLVNTIVPAKNFEFLGYEVIPQTGTAETINGYKYIKIQPSRFEINLPNTISYTTVMYEWQSCEQDKKGNWVIKIQISSPGGSYQMQEKVTVGMAVETRTVTKSQTPGIQTYEMVISPATGKATVKLRSSVDNTYTYRGSIRAF